MEKDAFFGVLFPFFTETAKIFGCILAWKEYTDNIMKY